MENQLAKSTEERTFQYQDSLPSLPVPSLEESLKKYLESVKPFANEEEYKNTEAIVWKFQNGIGEKLQQKLLQRAKGRRNWLEEWWLNVAYLDVRIPSQLNVNFGGPASHIEHYWPPKEGTQLERGSISLWHNLNYWQLLRKEKLAVEKVGNTPLDMNQFRMLFSTCKIPGITRDSIINYFRTESEGHSPSHLAVLCRGRVFVFDVMHEGYLMTAPEIQRQLTYIQKKCHSEPDGPGVAALTTEERTRWAKAREYLISLNPENLTILEKIQSSLLVFCLDDDSPHVTPEDYSQVSAKILNGDPTVRWGDKSYNLIAFSNGVFGSNCDHAPFDAMVLVKVCYYVDENILENEGRWKGSEKVRDIPVPEELVFTVDEKVLNDINQAKAQYFKQVSDLQLVVYAFTSFGKKLTKEKQLHPDTFIQLALQLAYYRLHGRSLLNLSRIFSILVSRLFICDSILISRFWIIFTIIIWNSLSEYIMRNAGLEEAQAGIKIAGRNINNLTYADDTTLLAESEEELKKSLLMKVKVESEKVGLKLNIQKTKITASSPIASWKIDGETVETVADFIFLGSKITTDGACSHEIKRRLLLGRKVMTNLDSILKSRDITLPTKVHLVKAMVFPVVMYGCESWMRESLGLQGDPTSSS
uniref:Peroxisomal carnitine O-octanoyltransferase n=1 Tax=Bos taurus TaxID=9913 RepID=A0AAA9SDI4_BOVIN